MRSTFHYNDRVPSNWRPLYGFPQRVLRTSSTYMRTLNRCDFTVNVSYALEEVLTSLAFSYHCAQ